MAGLTGCFGAAPSPDADVSFGVKPFELTILMQDGANEYAKNAKPDDMYMKELSKLYSNHRGAPYKINFEILRHDDYFKQLTVRFASGEFPDIMWTDAIGNSAHPTAAEDGIFLDLTELINQYGPNLKRDIPEYSWKDPKISKDGRIYGLPKMAALPNTTVDFVRNDWLKKLNMGLPQSLQDYLNYFEAIKTHDLDGNGQLDEIPYVVRGNFQYSTSFFGYFDAYPTVWKYRDGLFQPNLILPEMKDAILFYKLLYDKGYVNRNMFTLKASDWDQLIRTGKAGMWQHQVQALMNIFDSTTQTELNWDITALAGPRDLKGNAYLVPEQTGVNAAYVIFSKAKQPEEIIRFFDWLHSDDTEKNRFFAYGIKGHNYMETGGRITYDPLARVNKEKEAATFFQVMINPTGDNRLSPLLVHMSKNAVKVEDAIRMARTNTIDTESLYMPTPSAIRINPELAFSENSLFMDMFAKVVLGRESIDTAFDKFVADWLRRGGREAIQEATAWYELEYGVKSR
ncbi:extracellular solute-binding protein [Paenibacillus koleovorans]|uniref:extracellular solute-binding protein n=1 Tax=Paenibacillus koleovorans TaxID=121608 RepID=UPI001FEC2A5D|nr:extracellular solute-binding protein [Paenibacillus koleovorans]